MQRPNQRIEDIEQLYREFVPSGIPGAPPDRDHIQAVLLRKFVKLLNERNDLSPDFIAETFTGVWYDQLIYLGEERQDEILKDAMKQTGVDLSHWLEKE